MSPRFLSVSMFLFSVIVCYAAPETVNVRDFGAVGDGVADDSTAFTAAVAKAHELHCPVYVPYGQYVVNETLTLEDIGITGPAIGAWPADTASLPSLLVSRSGKPAIHLLAGGSVQGLDITCSGEADETTGTSTILISGVGCYVRNMRIKYPWDGIMTDGINNVGRLNIENVFMVSPLNVGVRVTGTWDVPALRNIEVWNAGPVQRGLDKGIGFLLGKNDLIRVTDCFVFAMQTGFMLEEKIEGCEIEGPTWGLLTGCSTDFCPRGIWVKGAHTVSVTGGTFWEHQESLLVEGKGGRVRVSGAELKSNGAPVVVVRGGDHVVITGCSILHNMEGQPYPAVIQEKGYMVLNDNFIEARSSEIAVVIGPEVRSTIMHGNMLQTWGNPTIDNQSPGNPSVMIKDNITAPIPEPDTDDELNNDEE